MSESKIFLKTVRILKKLAIQIGVCEALAVSLGQMATASQRASQQSSQTPPQQDTKQQLDSLVNDLTSLVVLLQQTQVEIYDILTSLNQKRKSSPISKKKIDWLVSYVGELERKMPPLEKPVLPLGSSLAVNLFLAENSTQETLEVLEDFWRKEKYPKKFSSQITQYLQNLRALFFNLGRWSNLTLIKKEFLWKRLSSS